MQRPFMPLAAFLAAVLICIPFLVQSPLRRREHLPYISLAFWLCLANIICGVDSIVWSDNTVVRVPVWCDIGKLAFKVVGMQGVY